MDGMDFVFDETQREMAKRLEELEQAHRELDKIVADMNVLDSTDMLRLQRLKREKLRMKDEIVRLRSQLCPNIIA